MVSQRISDFDNFKKVTIWSYKPMAFRVKLQAYDLVTRTYLGNWLFNETGIHSITYKMGRTKRLFHLLILLHSSFQKSSAK